MARAIWTGSITFGSVSIPAGASRTGDGADYADMAVDEATRGSSRGRRAS